MKGLRRTELATPFHPLYTPWAPGPGGTDKKMAHQGKIQKIKTQAARVTLSPMCRGLMRLLALTSITSMSLSLARFTHVLSISF